MNLENENGTQQGIPVNRQQKLATAGMRDRCAPPGKNKLKSTDERIGEIYRKYISVFGRMEMKFCSAKSADN